MNKEIKKILDNFEKYEARYKLHNETQFIITHREIQILLDYITNLQQYYNDNINKYEELLVKYSDLQKVINKAINYINKCRDYHKTYHKEEKIFPDEITSLLMILQRSDEE